MVWNNLVSRHKTLLYLRTAMGFRFDFMRLDSDHRAVVSGQAGFKCCVLATDPNVYCITSNYVDIW